MLVKAYKKQLWRMARGHHMLREPFRHVPNKNAVVRAPLNADRAEEDRQEGEKKRKEGIFFGFSSIITTNE